MTPTRRLGLALVCACATTVGLAFVPNVGTGCAAFRARQGVEARNTVIPSSHHHSSFAGSPIVHAGRAAGPRRHGNFAKRGRNGRGRSMGMLLGFDDTILGVGAPEVFIILAVGYFVLGPVELFKLTKQAGVLVGQLRDLGLGTVTNLGNIMDEQIKEAEQVASGERPPGYYDAEQEYPQGEEDEFEEVTLDEFGRIVYDDEAPTAPPVSEEDQAPFWDGWNTDKMGLNGEGPLKEASKFANQLSGAVNKKVLGLGDSDAAPDAADVGAEAWEGAEAAAAVTAGGAAGLGMANEWKAPTNELGMDQELANDVPSELSIDEQFERLDTIAALEQERASTMQRLEARIEAKIGSIKNELLELVDEDFQEKRAKVNRDFAEKTKAKAAAAAAASTAPASDTEAGNRTTTATAGRVRGEQ
ncbi:unnamed protein product [Laminaria digitata]